MSKKRPEGVELVTKWEVPFELRNESLAGDNHDARILTMPMIARPLHGPGCQPRTIFGKSAWDHMRKRCYFLADYHCEACGKDLGRGECQAHELFDTNWEEGYSRFVRCVCLCKTCVDEDTDVLTKDGWKKIPQVTTSDLVACWDKDGSVRFEHPIATTESFHEEAVEVRGHGATLYFSNDHRLPLKIASKQVSTHGEVVDVLAKDYKASHYYNWLIGGENKKNEHLTPEERVYIAIEADGSMVYDKENPRHGNRQRAYNNRYGSEKYRYTYSIHLLKTRKIERLKRLLEESGMRYKITKETSDSYCDFNIWSNKELKHFANCFDVDMGAEKALEFIEELVFWDGTYAQGATAWFTNKPEEIDFVQAIASQCNIRTSVHVINRIGNLRKGDWQTPYERLSYSVNFRSVTPELTGKTMEPKTIKWGKKMYCISVPTTYFIARRDGLVFVTGNCHLQSIHVGRMLTLYKQGNPLMPKRKVIEGAENLFKNIYEYNKAHPDMLIRAYAGILDALKIDSLKDDVSKLLSKYPVSFYAEDEKRMAKWGDWRVIIGGKEYPTPYKNSKEWRGAMEVVGKNDSDRKATNPFTDPVYDEIKQILAQKS